jgi:Xaa-Pro aminopeptidase
VSRLALLLLLPALSSAASDPFFPGEYKSRRAALRKSLPGAAVTVVGGDERERGDLRNGFVQDSNFLYLTGWREPGATLLITPDDEVLFLPKRNEVRDRYTGRKAAPGDPGIAAATGFTEVAEVGEIETRTKDAERKGWKLYTVGRVGSEAATNAVARLRMVKSPREIALIEESVAATLDAHKAAWMRIREGLYEYQVAATMMNVYLERGCERSAYPPIVAAGPNSIILHYGTNKRRMDGGELLLMDVGAECNSYAADITRTVPVSGRFTVRQREIYEVVLGAQKAAIAAAKPGMKLTGHGAGTLNQIALDYVNSHGKGPQGEPLGKYYLHQLGHHVGLDVHDATDPEVVLQPGMVVTIEPGIYIPEENIGVRIEDMILITPTGARVLSEALPREAREIERIFSQRRK